MFLAHLRGMLVLLLWDEKFYISIKSIRSRTLFNATTFLLIFCLEDLSIFDSEVLKSPPIIVLLEMFFL